jgi:hypothetical protein
MSTLTSVGSSTLSERGISIKILTLENKSAPQ